MIIDDYLQYQVNFQKKYGDNTLVLYQNGSFFELYGLNNEKEKIGSLQEICELLNIQLTRRNKSILENSRSNPQMAGFPIHSLKRYLPILLSNNYTVVLIEQTSEPPNPKREITQIFSPGTYIDEINSSDPNNIVSIYLTESNCYKTGGSLFLIGMSSIDLSTGKNMVYQGNVYSYDKNGLLEDIYRFIEANNPREVLFYHNDISKIQMEDVKRTLNSMSRIVHFSEEGGIAAKYFQLSYQNNFLGKIFPDHGLLSPIEYLDFERKYEAMISYLLLLQFSYEHNERIIERIKIPTAWEHNEHLILYHNAIYQLNIISTCKNRSLYDILNKGASTSLGRRLLKYRIMNPVVSTEELTIRYNNIDTMMNSGKINDVEKCLNEIIDIERFHRKISLQLLHPYEFLNLTYSYENIFALFRLLDMKELGMYDVVEKNMEDFAAFKTFYEYNFDLLEMGKYGLANISGSFFKKGIYEEIDALQTEMNEIQSFFDNEVRHLSNLIEPGSDFVKIEHNERDGYFYYCTKKRADILVKKVSGEDYKIEKYNGANVKIVGPKIMENSKRFLCLKDDIQKIVRDKYLFVLNQMYEKYNHVMETVSEFIAKIDVTKAGARCAMIYNYSRPQIVDKHDGQSFFEAGKIRHPIIEIINQELNYVENDVSLVKGDDTCNGILLYGVNGVGKSSLGKAIGCNIIMAQMGFYVAAENFVYYPYHKIFTRINGDDNIFKGMSSFVVEMSELKSILRYADNRSIVIGDEVCKGTEETSALSIVGTSVSLFAQKGVNFIFATHFHKLADLECIKSLRNVRFYHLSVEYDGEKDIIIYGRKLEEGRGSNLYGLEIANYIIKDEDFIAMAKCVRNEILCVDKNIMTDKKSNYNKDLYLDKCVICGDNGMEYPLDTHHIQEQNNFKGYEFQKDKMSNLVVLCKTHHDDVHHGALEIKGYVGTTGGKILDYKVEDKREKVGGKKKYGKEVIEVIQSLYEELKTQKESMKVLGLELKKRGINISSRILGKIIKGEY